MLFGDLIFSKFVPVRCFIPLYFIEIGTLLPKEVPARCPPAEDPWTPPVYGLVCVLAEVDDVAVLSAVARLAGFDVYGTHILVGIALQAVNAHGQHDFVALHWGHRVCSSSASYFGDCRLRSRCAYDRGARHR